MLMPSQHPLNTSSGWSYDRGSSRLAASTRAQARAHISMNQYRKFSLRHEIQTLSCAGINQVKADISLSDGFITRFMNDSVIPSKIFILVHRYVKYRISLTWKMFGQIFSTYFESATTQKGEWLLPAGQIMIYILLFYCRILVRVCKIKFHA